MMEPLNASTLTTYQKKLFLFLGVAGLFEGYDHMIISQVLTDIEKDHGLNHFQTSALIAFINVGTVLAYFLVRQADKYGRKPMLTLTITGYIVMTVLTGLSPSVILFALAQMIAKIFLIAEWAISNIYAAEEFPASRRAFVIGVLSALNAVGAIVCAGLVPFFKAHGFSWREVYFAGAIPLFLIAFGRRGLKETQRFLERGPVTQTPSLLKIWNTPYKIRVIQLACMWGLTYVCAQTSITFWKAHALEDLHLTEKAVGGIITKAALISMPLLFMVGKLLDHYGRKPMAVIIFSLCALSNFGAYLLPDGPMLFASVLFAMVGVSAVLPVMNAFTTEIIPTEHRSDAFAWANNLLGRTGYVLSPLLVGFFAEKYSWSVVAATSIGPLLALMLILFLFPETAKKELEHTAAL